jgi:hypothetical protein
VVSAGTGIPPRRSEAGARTLYGPPRSSGTGGQPVTLIDLLDRLLGAGVVVHGHITLAAADIDLVDLDLALLLASSDTARRSLSP